MKRDWKMILTALMLLALLGSVAGGVPRDVGADFLQSLQQVVQRIQAGLTLGFYRFALEPVDLGPGNRAFLTLQQASPRAGLAFLERGFPIARFSTEQGILISGVTIPAGDYYLILWISDKRFNRFDQSWLPRIPLLLLVTEQRFELVDFAIPCKVEVEVPNKNPDKIFPLTMALAPGACGQSASAAVDFFGTASQPQGEPMTPWSIGIWGIGKIFINSGMPIGNPEQLIPIPPAEELFRPQEGPEKPPEEPPVGPPVEPQPPV